MEPLVKSYLKNRSFQDLENDHGVCARPSACGTKFSLNYDSLIAKNGDPLSEQCRGMIIRPRSKQVDGDWKNVQVGDVDVVAWPMCRFYNHGDPAAANPDWSDPGLRVYEKVDGTCIILYWDSQQNRWHAATRSVPEADLPINANSLEIGNMTFSELFLNALIETRKEISGCIDWHVDGPDKIVHLNKELTYVFELVSRHNQIVVDYPDPRVYLLAARHTTSGEEIPIDSIRMEHVRRPKTWPITNVDELTVLINAISPSELEGAVVCDSNFRRLKIKSMAYVMAHKSKDSVTSSPRNALEAIIFEKADDIIPLIPKDVADKIMKMQSSYVKFCAKIDENVSTFKIESGNSRKRFAELVMLSGDWSAPYFNMWENRASTTREWIKKMADAGKLSTSMLDKILSKLAP
jgi:hypothetical protein